MSKVLKFGGTSVGSDTNMKMVASIIKSEGAKITVLSAMSGTTDALVKICSLAKTGNECSQILSLLKEKYCGCTFALLDKYKEEAKAKIDSTLEFIASEAQNFCATSEGMILSQGELLTTAIFTMYLKESGVKAELINILSYMNIDDLNHVDTNKLKEGLAKELASYDSDTYFITQGFICTNDSGEVTNLGRGGSDYSAALMGAAIEANEVQIWTDIDGMHNNDPRYVEGTYPIHRMSFTEAAELAYFGAKILHPATIQPCKENGISVRLKNTMDPAAEGTLITSEEDSQKTFHAVAAKDGITVVRIHSARMLMAYGFLRKVFEIFETHKTPIDMITTSEVAISLTIDSDSNLDVIVEELSALGSIEVERDNTIVCVVGRIGHTQAGLAANITNSLKTIPIKMISYGASNHSIALLVNSSDKVSALQLLNKTLFEDAEQ